MAYILALQPDPEQASALRGAIRAATKAEILIVNNTEAALAAIDRRVPDLVLLHALMAPTDDEHFVACLLALPDAAHVQVLRLPLLQPPPAPPTPWLSRLRARTAPAPIPHACHPGLFAADVIRYLTRASLLKKDIERRRAGEAERGSDRRRAPRWSPTDVPWVSSLQLAAGEQAELIDISTGGALVRTHERPKLPSLRRVHELGPATGLTLHLTSGEHVRVAGRVIRCRPESTGHHRALYEVAFRFDESADLYLPTPPFLVAPGHDNGWDMNLIAVDVIGELPYLSAASMNQW
jgi:hypothetical protein